MRVLLRCARDPVVPGSFARRAVRGDRRKKRKRLFFSPAKHVFLCVLKRPTVVVGRPACARSLSLRRFGPDPAGTRVSGKKTNKIKNDERKRGKNRESPPPRRIPSSGTRAITSARRSRRRPTSDLINHRGLAAKWTRHERSVPESFWPEINCAGDTRTRFVVTAAKTVRYRWCSLTDKSIRHVFQPRLTFYVQKKYSIRQTPLRTSVPTQHTHGPNEAVDFGRSCLATSLR